MSYVTIFYEIDEHAQHFQTFELLFLLAVDLFEPVSSLFTDGVFAIEAGSTVDFSEATLGASEAVDAALAVAGSPGAASAPPSAFARVFRFLMTTAAPATPTTTTTTTATMAMVPADIPFEAPVDAAREIPTNQFIPYSLGNAPVLNFLPFSCSVAVVG